jgi:hypothetical protein
MIQLHREKHGLLPVNIAALSAISWNILLPLHPSHLGPLCHYSSETRWLFRTVLLHIQKPTNLWKMAHIAEIITDVIVWMVVPELIWLWPVMVLRE